MPTHVEIEDKFPRFQAVRRNRYQREYRRRVAVEGIKTVIVTLAVLVAGYVAWWVLP